MSTVMMIAVGEDYRLDICIKKVHRHVHSNDVQISTVYRIRKYRLHVASHE